MIGTHIRILLLCNTLPVNWRSHSFISSQLHRLDIWAGVVGFFAQGLIIQNQMMTGAMLLIWDSKYSFKIDQMRSVAQLCLTLCDPMNRSTPGLPVPHQLLEFTQTHVPRVSDAIQPSHPLSSPSPPAPNPSQDQSLFQ